jgi:acetyl esterase
MLRSIVAGVAVISGLLCCALALRAEERSGTDEAAKGTLIKEYKYKDIEQGELKIYVHFPEGWSERDRRPTIVFFHGAGWRVVFTGSVEQFTKAAEYFASRGMIAARAEYRLKEWGNPSTFVDSVEDAKSAVRWLRKNAQELGIDPNRIVAAGGSAGGHLAACTALCNGLEPGGEDLSVSSRPNALVLFNPLLDLLQFVERRQRHNAEVERLAKLISPTLQIEKNTPPTIMFYGMKDLLLKQGQEYVKRARQHGNRVDLFTAKRKSHGFFNTSPWRERTLYEADKFLASIGYLQGDPTIAAPPLEKGEQMQKR